MTLLAPTVFIESFAVMVACFAVSTFSYAALSTMILNLPADVYPTGSVASVSGLSGTGAGIGTIAATLLTGAIADRMSFSPILIGASLVPLWMRRRRVAARAQHRGDAPGRAAGDLISGIPDP